MATQRRSTTNLAATGGAGDTWDTGFFPIGLQDDIVGVVVANQTCTVQVQHSSDGTLVDAIETVTWTAPTFDGSGNVTNTPAGGVINVSPKLAYARVVVKNTAASPTTIFRATVRGASAGPR